MENAQFGCQQSADDLLLTGLDDQWRVKAVLEAILSEWLHPIASEIRVGEELILCVQTSVCASARHAQIFSQGVVSFQESNQKTTARINFLSFQKIFKTLLLPT